MENNYYENLSKVDVSGLLEKKSNLSYLSWAHAIDQVLKRYPDMIYEIIKYDGKPYYMDETGAMVYTKVTIEGVTREMWLPVMDGANKTMKKEAYTYKTKFGDKQVEAISMFDVNKTIMRCLVKNLAMFGLGISVYAGEDLPLIDETEKTIEEKAINTFGKPFDIMVQEQNKELHGKCPKCGASMIKSKTTGNVFCQDRCWSKK